MYKLKGALKPLKWYNAKKLINWHRSKLNKENSFLKCFYYEKRKSHISKFKTAVYSNNYFISEC